MRCPSRPRSHVLAAACWLTATALCSSVGCDPRGQQSAARGLSVQSAFAASHVEPIFTPGQDVRLLLVLLKLRKDTEQTDRAIVDALAQLRWFTHVILTVPSWQEVPEASEHELVRRAAAALREQGIGLVWGRWLWVAWPEGVKDAPTSESHFEADFYSEAIRRVRRESASLGAVGTFLDAEPYGQSAQKPTMKFTELTESDRVRIHHAVSQAVAEAGPVDLIYPTSSMRPSHFGWPLADLGVLRCDSKTYYVRAPQYRLPVVRPPPGYEHRLDLWGVNVGLAATGSTDRRSQPLTVGELLALDLHDIRRQYPGCRGLWVYMDYSIMADVLRNWPN